MKLNLGILSVFAFAVVFAGCRKDIVPGPEPEPEPLQHAFTKDSMAERIDDYLGNSYSCSVERVSAGKTEICISGVCQGSGNFRLVEIEPCDDVSEYLIYPRRHILKTDNGHFSLTLPRWEERDGINYDRALSKWAVILSSPEKDELVSSARYADEITALRSASETPLKTKKGLGAGFGNLYINDLSELGIGSITMNLSLDDFFSAEALQGWTEYPYNGRLYHINLSRVSDIDRMTRAASSRGIVVAAIILVPSTSPLADPECNGGHYAMPDMTSAEAVNRYAAALEFLSERYSSGVHGRINHWIMHNEVSAAKEWTNMGEQPAARCFDRYVKSMRLCYNIVRQYDRNASVMVSLTHSWTRAENGHSAEYCSKSLLERLVRYSELEGDFRWGVAYHPYPVDLADPLFWKEGSLDCKYATFGPDAGYVTFYNPEVINAWILDRSHYYLNESKRLLFFSEQGTNTRSYSNEDMENQAAGAAWFWKKIKDLEGVDAAQWHAHSDNREEFGLRLGLRNYDDYGPKPSWYVWKAADTDEEEAVFSSYLPILGLQSWDALVRELN